VPAARRADPGSGWPDSAATVMTSGFNPRLDASRPSRELAIARAEEERKDIEKSGA